MTKYIDVIPLDMVSSLLTYLSPRELIKVIDGLVTEEKLYWDIINCKMLWTELWRRDVSEIVTPPPDIVPNENTAIFVPYRELVNKSYSIDYSSQNLQIIYDLAKNGYEKLIYSILNDNKGTSLLGVYDSILEGAAYGGHKQLMEDMVKLGAHQNSILIGAARSGNKELAEEAISLGASSYNMAMTAAAREDRLEMIDLMLEYGGFAYDSTLSIAAYNGNSAILEKMLQLGAKDITWALRWAASEKHESIVKRLLEFDVSKHYIEDVIIPLLEGSDYKNIVDMLRAYTLTINS